MIGLGLGLTKIASHGGTSAFSPDQIAGLAGWFDASAFDTLTLAGSEVVAMTNRVPNGLNLSKVASGGPAYDPTGAGGLPSLVWPNEPNNKGLALATDAGGIEELFVVCQYLDGINGLWPFISLISTYSTTLTNSLALSGFGTAELRSGTQEPGVSRLIETASVNSGAFSSTVLPLPLSVMRFNGRETDSPGPITLAAFGFNLEEPNELRSWRGPICEILAYTAPLTPAHVADVEAYLYAKWGITPPPAATTELLLDGSPLTLSGDPLTLE